jgi:hypothetical protein
VFRKRFWTDVLRSLKLSYDLLADEARAFSRGRLRLMPDEYIPDLAARIAAYVTPRSPNDYPAATFSKLES